MKHSCLINGYDTLNLTKLDVLETLPEIKVAVKYIIDGKTLSYFPGTYQVILWEMDLNPVGS
jgi:adenylosuccinate synthase